MIFFFFLKPGLVWETLGSNYSRPRGLSLQPQPFMWQSKLRMWLGGFWERPSLQAESSACAPAYQGRKLAGTFKILSLSNGAKQRVLCVRLKSLETALPCAIRKT